MLSVLKYLKEFYLKEFNGMYFLAILLLLSIILYLNYWQGLEKKYIAAEPNKLLRFAKYYLLYCIPFFTAFLLQILCFKDVSYYSNKWFWIIVLLAPAMFSFRVNFTLQEYWVIARWQGALQTYYLYCINWIVRVFVLMLPIIIIWWAKDSQNQPLYGTKALASIKPYLIMLLLMLPLLAWASTQPDFLKMYPKAKILHSIPANGFTDKLRYLFFELSYGFDFVSIEFFFRGFLVLSLLQICGMHCIIPIACFYFTIHLGKPMAEAVSSFLGGMLLGIITYNTGSIWGGLMVHLGIAWLMELGGYIGMAMPSKR